MLTITPRDYQQAVVDKSIDSYDRGIRRQLFESATGTGKTYTSTFLVDAFRKHVRGKKKAMFLVDEINLAYQARKSFVTANPDWNIGIEMNDHEFSKKDDIVITSIPTIGRKGSRRIKKFDPDEFGMVIVDEAHKSISDSWIRSLNYLQVGPDNFDSDKLLFGMTATPNRPDGKPLNILYDDIIEKFDLRWALQNGWLTDFEFIRVDTDTDISHVKKNRGEFVQRDLNSAVNNPDRNAQIFKAYKEYSDEEPAICFTASVDHAKTLTELFNINGVPSATIEANTPKEKRKQYIADYKAGKIKVLFNYATLTTGFDAPDTTTIILARPIGSQLLYQQILGRGLRPSSDSLVDAFNTSKERALAMQFSQKPYCKVIDFHDVTIDKSACTPSSLFGLHPDMSTEPKKKFYKDVVEVLDDKQKEHQIDVSEIKNLDDIELAVRRSKSSLSSVTSIPDEIQLHSNKAWSKISDEHYEISFPMEDKILVVTTNQLEQYDLSEYDMKEKETRNLNTFGSLSGAINNADRFADNNYNTKMADVEEWMDDGITRKQSKILKRFLSGKGLKIDSKDRYEDTHVPLHYYSGDLLHKGSATRLISRLFNR
ncbi:DEAD/DEAH box helicase [Gracilimonas sp. Q87]|uniref:DEAD/DEAH box helicase n=1 Tax=Gracilimonas sp. Q87 TaxID=3384766 RepID=UPI0039842E91